MATSQIRFCGVLLQYKTGEATWTTISSLRQPMVPGFERDAVDATHTGSGSGGVCYREQIPGVINRLNSITCILNYDQDDSIHQAVVALRTSRVMQTFRLYDNVNGETIWEADGFITAEEFSMGADAPQTLEVTIEFSGAPTTYGG